MDLDDMLKDLNCTDGFHIPIANEENKLLELEIKKQQQDKNDVLSQLEETKDRLESLRKYYKTVQTEKTQFQKLVLAHDQQLHTETDLFKISQSEITSYNSELRQLKKDGESVEERYRFIECDLIKCANKLKKLSEALKWDQEAQKSWEMEMVRVGEDAEFLENFTKKDKARFEELEYKRKITREEVEAKQLKMEILNNEVICLEQSLEKTSALFQRQHEDRQRLVQQWNATVRVLHEREEEINRLVEEIGILRTQAKQRVRDLRENQTFYENERENNKASEREFAKLAKESSLAKNHVQELNETVCDLKGQLLTLRGILSANAHALENCRSKCNTFLEHIQQKEELCNIITERIDILQTSKLEAKDKKISAADRLRKLQDMLTDEENSLRKTICHYEKLQGKMKSTLDDLNVWKDQEVKENSEFQRLEGVKNKLHKHFARLTKDLQDQKQCLYNVDIAITKKEIELRHILGAYDPAEKEKLTEKLNELTNVYKEVSETHAMLEKECFRLDQEYRRLIFVLEQDGKELSLLKNKKQDFQLTVEGASKELKSLRNKIQDRQVDKNLLKLKFKQMTNAVQRMDGKVLDLEKQRLELDECAKERALELKTCMDCLNVRKRCLQEKASNFQHLINVASLKVNHLKSKYEVSAGSLCGSQELQSMAYYKIKSAQERMELQVYGDQLDEKIRKAEKELGAIENTLKVVHNTNKVFKNNLLNPQQSTEDNPQEMQNLEQLCEKEIGALDALRIKFDELNNLSKELSKELENHDAIQENILVLWKRQNDDAKALDKDLQDQEEKLIRAWKMVKKCIKDIRGTTQARYQTHDEKDIELREIMEQNKLALQQLMESVVRNIDIDPVVTKYLSEKGISMQDLKIPSRLSSARSISSSTLLQNEISQAKDKKKVSYRDDNVTPQVSTITYKFPSK